MKMLCDACGREPLLMYELPYYVEWSTTPLVSSVCRDCYKRVSGGFPDEEDVENEEEI